LPPVATSRNRAMPLPVGPSTAIQYLVPLVTATVGTAMVFHAPFVGALMVACVSSVPGLLPPTSAYRPTTILVAALLESTYTLMRLTWPLAVAVYWKASALPAGL